MQVLSLLVVALFAAGAAGQEFPFKNGPLDPSLHSNKIFYDIQSLDEIAGVWKGVTALMHWIVQSDALFNGSVPLDQICTEANAGGIYYSHLTRFPQTVIVFGPQEDSQVGRLVDTRVNRFDEVEVMEFSDGLMRLEDGACRTWRPYFDWEVGKSMYIRNRRFYAWEEDGQFRANQLDFCVTGEVDHPYCTEGSFIIDGQEKIGVILDTVAFYECVAGPCLELPHSLPGYVKTQGWQPRE